MFVVVTGGEFFRKGGGEGVPNPVLQLAELLQDDPWLRERLFITCRGKTDGCGAQAHAVMSALAFAKAVGVTYLHSPFFRVAHGPKGVGWALQCESFFGLGNGEMNADATTVPLEMLMSKPRPLGRTVVEAPHYHAFLGNPDFYSVIAPDLRRKYASSDKSELPLHRAVEGITVGVHLRRGDVVPAHPKFHLYARRYTPDESNLQAITELRYVAGELSVPIKVNVFSEGSPEKFRCYVDAGCDVHISTDPFETFHNLVCSDILVSAKSSFSYVAAILSTGIVIYEPFWHKPMSAWIVRDVAGQVNRAQLRSGICRALNLG
jgi:hypothetical protein